MGSEGEASPPRKRMLLELPSEHQSQNLTLSPHANTSQPFGVSASSSTPAATSHEQGANPEEGINLDEDLAKTLLPCLRKFIDLTELFSGTLYPTANLFLKGFVRLSFYLLIGVIASISLLLTWKHYDGQV